VDASPSRLTIGATFALLILIWGTTWSVIRVSLEGIPPFTGVSIRFTIAALILWGLARAKGVRLAGGPLWLWVVQALFAFSASYGPIYWAEQWLPSGLTAVFYSTLPLFVAIFAYGALPGERKGWLGFAGVLLGFAGIAVIFSDDFGVLADPQVRLAALVSLIGPFGNAAAQVTVKRWGQGVHALSLTAPPMAMTAALFAVLALVVERDREIVLDTGPVLATLYLAVAGTALTFSLFFWLLKHVTATRMSYVAYFVPMVAVVVGTVFLDEPLTARMVAGSALVIVGVVVASRSRSRQ
jgi:drug/metabolite transporter (DMT)-like permease